MRRLAAVAFVAAVILGIVLWCLPVASPRVAPLRARLAIGDLLGGAADGFLRADRPRPFRFPADHGPHDGFRTEWWYLTGHLADPGGRRFGFQVTFFRQALAPEVEPSASRWRTAHLWMAHFALTDVDGRRFDAFERFGREALGIAGAQDSPPKVFLDAWELAADDAAATSFRVVASEGEVALDLRLVPQRPPVLQGEEGLSSKGPEPGNASYYYSWPRLESIGSLTLGERRFEVSGLAWLDREWSTSALSADLAGWDWVALHLDDGSDLMLYRLRRGDGSSASESAASWRAADGEISRFDASEIVWTELDRWPSPRGGEYPSRWRLEIPGRALRLEIEPLLDDQELALSLRYWEGAVDARGTLADAPLAGRGYVELTGYAAEPPER